MLTSPFKIHINHHTETHWNPGCTLHCFFFFSSEVWVSEGRQTFFYWSFLTEMVNQINDHHFSDKKAKEVCQGFLDEWSQFAHESPLL